MTIPTSYLNHLQGQAVRFQPDTCDIIRVTETQTSGGTDETPSPIASGVSCFYSEEITPQDVARAEVRSIVISAKILIPADQEITATDRVAVTVRGSVLGTFEVVTVVRQSYEALRLIYLSGPV